MTASTPLEGEPEAPSQRFGHARALLGGASKGIDEARRLADRAVGFLARMRTPLGEVRPYVPGETPNSPGRWPCPPCSGS